MVADGHTSVPVRASRLRHRGLVTRQGIDGYRAGIDAPPPGRSHALMPPLASSRVAGLLTATRASAFPLGASNSIYMIMPAQTITWSRP